MLLCVLPSASKWPILRLTASLDEASEESATVSLAAPLVKGWFSGALRIPTVKLKRHQQERREENRMYRTPVSPGDMGLPICEEVGVRLKQDQDGSDRGIVAGAGQTSRRR